MAGMAGGITRMVSVQWEMEPCIIECAQGGGTKKGSPDTKGFPDKKIEQVMGIEPTYLAWKASVLPLNYTCMKSIYLIIIGVTGFEPAASWSQTRRSSQAEPHPAFQPLRKLDSIDSTQSINLVLIRSSTRPIDNARVIIYESPSLVNHFLTINSEVVRIS